MPDCELAADCTGKLCPAAICVPDNGLVMRTAGNGDGETSVNDSVDVCASVGL
jgi:hypothetical protein